MSNKEQPVIVHLGTKMEAYFGVADEDGNVVPQEPIGVTVHRFEEKGFTTAFELLVAARDKLANPPDAEPEPTPPNRAARRAQTRKKAPASANGKATQ